MESDLARRVGARREHLLAVIGDRLAAEPLAELSAELRELEAWDRVRSSLPTSRTAGLLSPLVVGVLAVTLVGLAWSLPRPTTRIVLEVETDGLSFRPAVDWVWPNMLPQADATIRIAEVTRVELPAANEAVESNRGAAWATLDVGRMKLANVVVGNGSSVTLEQLPGNGVKLFVGDGAFTGTLAVWSRVAVQAGPSAGKMTVDEVHNFAVPETIAFAGGNGTPPASIELPTKRALELWPVPARELGLAREFAPQPGRTSVVSTIRGGRLLLPDTGSELALGPGDRLRLSGVIGTISRLRLADSIHLSFEGDVARVLVGPAGFERNLMPSWLDWLYHNQKLLFLWSAVSCVAGLLWSARRLLGA